MDDWLHPHKTWHPHKTMCLLLHVLTSNKGILLKRPIPGYDTTRKFLHVPKQHCCHTMGKMQYWLYYHNLNKSKTRARMWNMISSPVMPTICLEQKSKNLRIATWHYRCRHNLKNNCIWDNLRCCLLVPRSPSKPVMLTFDLQSRKVLFIEMVFWHV